MDDLDRLVIEAACTRLINDYCRFVDFGEAARIADLFTEDGWWEASDGVRMVGRAGLLEGFGHRQALQRRVSRHVCTNVSIDVLGPDEARGLCYLINYRHDSDSDGDAPAPMPAPAGDPKYVGEYHDRYVRTPDGWRFSERRFDLAFLRPRSRPRS